MKKASGILNSALCRVLAEMGHTDEILISDAGLPLPRGVERIDLALTDNVPRFLDVLELVLHDLTVEGAVLAEEVVERSPSLWAAIRETLPSHVVPVLVPHAVFKTRSLGVRAAVRTGEFTWYANVILVGGVSY